MLVLVLILKDSFQVLVIVLVPVASVHVLIVVLARYVNEDEINNIVIQWCWCDGSYCVAYISRRILDLVTLLCFQLRYFHVHRVIDLSLKKAFIHLSFPSALHRVCTSSRSITGLMSRR